LTYFRGADDDLFTSHDAQPEKIDNNPDMEEMVKFINEHSGRQRTVNGTLIPTAGHIKQFNDLISQVSNIDHEFITQLDEMTRDLQSPDSNNDYDESHVSWYRSYGQKISERGWGYAQHELERLEKMIEPTSRISPKKKTEINLRVNILQAFFKYFRHTYATMA
jgi:hypothetical protein